jgi:serine/threonine protein kinase
MLWDYKHLNWENNGCKDNWKKHIKEKESKAESIDFSPILINLKLLSEIKIHRSLKQENIVNFEHVFEDHDSVYILLEMCSN